MGDLHRIHPFPDLESAAAGSPVPHPTVPLLPSSAASSEKGDPTTAQTPPPQPRHHLRLLLILCTSLILFVGLLTAAFYLFFHPKLPHYSISGLHITNNTLSTAFTARNPNNRIGIYYDHGSRLSVLYDNTELFQGYLPVFYQGHRNTTVIAVALSGMTPNNATAIARDGGVALVIKGKVRVRVKLGKLKIGKRMVIKVRCEVIVDSLSSIDGKINIKSSSCKIHL